MKNGVRSLASLASLLLLGMSLAAQDIQVNSADPPSAPQATINLNVTIKGKGFKRGATAKFFVTRTTDEGGVTVNSTTFVGGSEVVANINVSDTAVIANFDIEVQNSDGRTGKGTELFSVLPKGSVAPSSYPLARAKFGDLATDRIRSDGKVLLGSTCPAYDYADANDPCQPGYQMISEVLSTGMYFLRTLITTDLNPTRWMVLDFSQPLSGSSCPGLDTKLKSYPGRNPAAFSPEDPNKDPCIDWLEVRFFADKAYAPGAVFTPLRIIIDGPDSTDRQSTGVQWNSKYTLEFVNPLTITPNSADPNTITVTTQVGLEQAQLWKGNPNNVKKQTPLGTYWMPFQVKITKLP